jgi:tRNA-uridine 2-sulfurtransferase
MKPSIAIAMSGGVDSTVAAYLLKRQGRHVFGIHFITGYETDGRPGSGSTEADGAGNPDKLQRITDSLGIRLEVMDIRSEFQSSVVDYFIRTYRSGLTPNPCMVCNPAIKFGSVLAASQRLGAEQIATGHYAAVEKDEKGRFHLLRGRDPEKEQSYFLAMLTQEQLARTVFPLGKMIKPEVRRIARENGVAHLIGKESQDICFIKKNDYRTFLKQHGGIRPTPGPIIDMDSRVVGQHNGLHRFTIGQRRGINCPAAEPYYVVRIDVAENRLIVGRKDDLRASECRLNKVNWIIPVPTVPTAVDTRVRYRHTAVPSVVIPKQGHKAVVKFQIPESAITPGQCAVFYRQNEVLGGGWIER